MNRFPSQNSSCSHRSRPRRLRLTMGTLFRGAVLLAVLWPAAWNAAGAEKQPDVGAAGKSDVRALWPVAKDGPAWFHRRYGAAGKEERTPVKVVNQTAVLPVAFPGPNEFVMHPCGSLMGWNRIEFVLRFPADFPPDALTYVFTKDWNYLWRQVRVDVRRPADPGKEWTAVVSVPLTGPEAQKAWTPCGHVRPWHTLTPAQITELGIKFDSPAGSRKAYTGACGLLAVRLRGRVRQAAPPRITSLECIPAHPRVGDVVECRATVESVFSDPFDRKQIAVDAVVTGPDGKQRVYPGFYAEGFRFRDENQPYGLLPWGSPYFAVRFIPERSGRYQVRLRVRSGKATVESPPTNLTVSESAEPFHGCVRVDPTDRRFFSFRDGTYFEGLGINVRSPYDTRYIENVPYSTWRDEDLGVYARLFPKYQRAGINVVEVWMCSWWLALEWIPDRIGYHGVGWMNQYHAWKLDRIFDWARRHGIYVILVFNNHGKFGTTFDREWDRNPFNVKNGGFLDDCEKYFSDARAKAAFRKFADYAVARWAAEPNLLAWKLFTEVDLTGNSLEFYLNPVVARWHKEMGTYVRDIDPWDHPITTHWMLSYQRINADIADLPQLDFLTTDAYYTSGSTPDMIALLEGSVQFLTQHKKPLLITEFGGSPYGESMGNLIKQLHLGLWTGFFSPFPIPPMYWWFALVDEKNLYGEYRALRNFGAGEDRRGMKYGEQEISGAGVRVRWLRLADRLLLWACDEKWYYSPAENEPARTITNLAVPLPPLPTGAWRVEFWDVAAGTVVGRRELTVSPAANGATEGTATLPLPPFRKDVAARIVRVLPPGGKKDNTARAPQH